MCGMKQKLVESGMDPSGGRNGSPIIRIFLLLFPSDMFLFRFLHLPALTFQWRIYIVKFSMRAPPPRFENSFNFMQFLEILAKSYVGAPLPGSWRPLLGEILDPPLQKDPCTQKDPLFSLRVLQRDR